MRARAVGVAAVLLLVALPGAVSLGAAAQTVTLTMRDFSYTPDRITVQGGIPVVLTLNNKGKVPHVFAVYDQPKSASIALLRAWAERTNYFHGLTVETSGGRVTRAGTDFVEMKVLAGKTATLRFTPVKKGTFEMGCIIDDHYQAGQHGVLIVK